MKPDPFPMWLRHVLWLAIGFAYHFALLRWLWPWLGPKLIQPCPMVSLVGCYVLSGWWALVYWGRRFSTHITDERIRRMRSSLYR
jgi:hypothetical protein